MTMIIDLVLNQFMCHLSIFFLIKKYTFSIVENQRNKTSEDVFYIRLYKFTQAEKRVRPLFSSEPTLMEDSWYAESWEDVWYS